MRIWKSDRRANASPDSNPTVQRYLLFAGMAFGLALTFSTSAFAQNQGGVNGTGIVDECYCGLKDLGPEATSKECFVNQACEDVTADCHDNDDCIFGGYCLSYARSGCTDPDIGNVCGDGSQVCQGTCTRVSTPGASCTGGGACEFEFALCSAKAAPTLTQWGLIFSGLLMCAAIFHTLRRRGALTGITASLLVLMSVGLIAVVGSYAAIDANRCEYGSRVEFERDVLSG